MITVLVVGARGYLGSSIKLELEGKGYHVIPYRHKNDVIPEIIFDLVIYAHGYRGYASNESEVMSYLETINFIESNFQIGRSVLLSSTRLEYEGMGSYVQGRREAEKMLKHSSTNNLVLRLSNVVSQDMPHTSFIGNLIHLANRTGEGNKNIIVAPNQFRDYILKNEIGPILVDCIDNLDGGIVRVGNNDELSNMQVLEILNLTEQIKCSNANETQLKIADFDKEYNLRPPEPKMNSFMSIYNSLVRI